MSHGLAIPATSEFYGDKPPKFLARKVVRNPDLDLGGVYLWTYDGRYAYVGSAKCLKMRLRYHCRLLAGTVKYINTGKKHAHVARKYAGTAKLFILENGQYEMSEVYELERQWLAYFKDIAPEGLLLNDHMLPGGGMSNKKAMKRRWTPEARQERSDYMKRQAKKQWRNPEFVAMQAEILARARKARWDKYRREHGN